MFLSQFFSHLISFAVYYGTGGCKQPSGARAAACAIVEVEEIVPTGTFDPDSVHLPGIYVHRLVLNATPEKRIEKRTITEKSGA